MNGQHIDNEIQELQEIFGHNLTVYRGNGPPPLRVNPMDNFDMEMFTDYYKLPKDREAVTDEDIGAPDFRGIQDMLQMVRDHGDLPVYSGQDQEASAPSNTASDVTIELTKTELNPEVSEFVPKSIRANDTKSDSDLAKNLDVTNLQPDEAKQKAALLKNQLGDMQKRERNVAMASLTKLYSVYNTPQDGTEPSPTQTDKPNVLLTPAYFKPEEEENTPPAPEAPPKETVDEAGLKTMTEGIKKVNDWLYPKEKRLPKKGMMFEKPTYKKKETKSPVTPVEKAPTASPVSESNTSKSNDRSTQSTNAAWWLEHFNQQSAAKEAQAQLDRDHDVTIWDVVERKMKMKELELKRKNGCEEAV